MNEKEGKREGERGGGIKEGKEGKKVGREGGTTGGRKKKYKSVVVWATIRSPQGTVR